MKKPRQFACTLLFAITVMVWTAAGGAQLRQIAIIDVPGHPGFDSLVFAGNQLVMAHTSASEVDIFDPAKRRIVARIPDLAEPRGLAADDQAGRVYVACSGNNSIAVISTRDWKVMETIPLAASPDSLLLAPGGETLYVSNWHDQSLSAVNTATHRAQTVALESRPEDMVIDAERKLLYVSLEDANQIVALDAALKPVKRFRLNGSLPTGLAFDARTRRLFVAVRYAVLVLDAEDGHEISRVPTNAGADKLWFDDSTATVYAASGGGAITMIRAQGSRYVAEQELNTAVRGHSVAFDPARGLAYVPGGFEGRSKLVILKRIENPPARNAAADLR